MSTRRLYVLGFLGWLGFGWNTDTASEDTSVDTAIEEQEQAPIEEAVISTPVPSLFEGHERPLTLNELPEGISGVSSTSCISCHTDITHQWQQSEHAKAFRDTKFQEKLQQYANTTLCSQCHAPLQLQHHQLPSSYIDGDPLKPVFSENPNWDAVLASESVNCASCHIRDGKILGIHENTNAPHEIVVSEELSSSQSCAGCHQFSWDQLPFPMYNTYEEWKNSPHAQVNIQCQDCHMPPKATSNAFAPPLQASHHFSQSIAQAFTISVSLPSPILKRAINIPLDVHLTNAGAGHALPTGNPWKQYRLILTLKNDKGRDLITSQTHIIGRIQNKEGQFIEDKRLQSGEKRKFSFDINISKKKRSGSATLSLLLDTGDEEPKQIWDLPVDVQ